MKKVRVLVSESVDPWFNLAVEEAIFSSMDPNQKVLFLWRNDNTVVIGRAQNPWKECNTRKMNEDNVKLARRNSGGGAVFHDLGNTNFTFMTGKPEYNKETSTQIIIEALKKLGLEVEASGRNDLVIHQDGEIRKVSGSAYREKADRGFHHGTLLLNVDFSRLANYLNPDPKKLQAKGITSVRSRVANLSELLPGITHDIIGRAIKKEFYEHYGEVVEPEYISESNLPNIEGFAEKYAEQSSWDWNYGKALEFNHHFDERFTWGGVEVQLVVKDGVIVEAKIYSDSLYLASLEALEAGLINLRYEQGEINQLFERLKDEYSDVKESLSELQTWFVEQIK